MSEVTPKQERSKTFELVKGQDGVWQLIDSLDPKPSPEVYKCLEGIEGFPEMTDTERVESLVAVMEALSPKTEEEVVSKNGNRFLVEDLARVTRAIEVYREILSRNAELSQLVGISIDVHA